MAATKRIKVTCTSSHKAALGDLLVIQGDLKTLSDEAFQKLTVSILTYGITFPFFCWLNDGSKYLVDGTQRTHVLRALEQKGYTIPMLPVDYIDAKDEREAKEKILLICSQYGRYSEDSVYKFVETAHIDYEALRPMLDLPQINIGKLTTGYYRDKDGAGVGGGSPKDVTCPECGHIFSPKKKD